MNLFVSNMLRCFVNKQYLTYRLIHNYRVKLSVNKFIDLLKGDKTVMFLNLAKYLREALHTG